MYYVIGGQYAYHYYGASKTLRGAKMLASHNKEYWDNFAGLVTPCIYTEESVIITDDGEANVLPLGDFAYYHDGKKWCEQSTRI